MKTITFEHVTPPTDHQLKYATYRLDENKGNGLFSLLYKGYSAHLPIVIRPDDVLNNVLSIWSKYIVINAEKFRSFFVEHEGKKVLNYKSYGCYAEGRLQEFFDGLLALVESDQGNDDVLWASHADFTTTLANDKFIRGAATLASQKKYYEYKATLCCGFTSITLDGTQDDWESLKDVIKKMPIPNDDIYLEHWKNSVLHVIDDMIGVDEEDFWQSAISSKPYGSGGQYTLSGWAVVFNPFTESGQWVSSFDNSDILDLTTEFEINVDDNGNEFALEIISGPVNLAFEDGVLSVKNVSNIIEKQTA